MGTWNHDRTRYYAGTVVTRHSHDDDFHVQAAREALTRPESFGYHGDLPLFDSWGITFTQTRDSDVTERSNYRTILAHLQELAKYHVNEALTLVDEIHCGHWAYGWADHIVVRVLIDDTLPTTADNITNVFKVAADIARALNEEYPIFDESDFSELESEDHFELWTNCVWPDFKRGQDDDRYNWHGLNETLRDESDYLDAMDGDDVYYEAGQNAPEHDPSTWDDDDIMSGVVRVAEELAHEENETRTPDAWWRDGDDRIWDDGVFLVLDTHAHSHGGYVTTVDREHLRDALKHSAMHRQDTINHDRDILARHNMLGNRTVATPVNEV